MYHILRFLMNQLDADIANCLCLKSKEAIVGNHITLFRVQIPMFLTNTYEGIRAFTTLDNVRKKWHLWDA